MSKKKSVVGVIVLVCLIFCLAIGGFGAYYFISARDANEEQAADAKDKEKDKDEKDSVKDKKKEKNSQKEKATEDLVEEVDEDVATSDVTFEHVFKDGMESCVITCVDAAGDELWTVKPKAVEMTELDQFVEIGVYNDLYYYVDAAHVTALDLATGTQKWQVTYYNICPCEEAFDFDEEGNLFIAGYYGPDFVGISKYGEVLCAYETFSDDFWWPTVVTVADTKATIQFDGSFDDNGGEVVVDLTDYSYAVGASGGARIVSAVASSVLEQDNTNYGSANIFDGNAATAWVEGANGNGVGESIRIYFDGETTVHVVDIYNGYQKSEDLYFKNARATALDLSFSDGSTQRVYVASDHLGMESVSFDSVTTNYVDIKIVSAASGSTYTDLCISEVSFR